jgi:hypothetical protein
VTEHLLAAWTPGLPNISEGAPVTVGNTITFATAGNVTEALWYGPSTVGAGTYQAALWQVSTDDVPADSGTGTLLGTPATFGAITPGAWNTVSFASPIPVVAGVAYRISVRTSEGRYAATGGQWNSALTVGNITGIQGDTDAVGIGSLVNGCFIENITAYPNKTFGHNGYGVDVGFTATVAGPTTVTKDLDIRWNVRARVTKTLDIRWNVDSAAPIVQDGASYEIGEIMDALAATFNGVVTGDALNGVAQAISCAAEVPAQISVPAIVLEIDDLDWDLNMGAGADGFTVLATVLVQLQDLASAQRELWRFLSRRSTAGVARLKAALVANQSLGDTVSYAIFSRVRSIGTIKYNGVDYLGAELIIEIVS